MKHLPSIINFFTGALLFLLGLIGYVKPDWFFNQKHEVQMLTPQSVTILRVTMGFMATIGVIWFSAWWTCRKQRRLLLYTGILTAGFVFSRLGGLFLDGLNQHFTYIELGFEVIALFIIIQVYFKTQSTPA